MQPFHEVRLGLQRSKCEVIELEDLVVNSINSSTETLGHGIEKLSESQIGILCIYSAFYLQSEKFTRKRIIQDFLFVVHLHWDDFYILLLSLTAHN